MDVKEILSTLETTLKKAVSGGAVREMNAEELVVYATEQITKAATEDSEGQKKRLIALGKALAEARKELTDPDSKAQVVVYDDGVSKESDLVSAKLDAIVASLTSLKEAIDGSGSSDSTDGDDNSSSAADGGVESSTEAAGGDASTGTAAEGEGDGVGASSDSADAADAADAGDNGDVTKRDRDFDWPHDLNTEAFRKGKAEEDPDWGRDPQPRSAG